MLLAVGFEWTFITSASQSVMVTKILAVGVQWQYMPLASGFDGHLLPWQLVCNGDTKSHWPVGLNRHLLPWPVGLYSDKSRLVGVYAIYALASRF